MDAPDRRHRCQFARPIPNHDLATPDDVLGWNPLLELPGGLISGQIFYSSPYRTSLPDIFTKLQPKVSLVEPGNGAHMQTSKMAKPRLGPYVVSHQGSRSWCVSAYSQRISDIGVS